MSKYAKALFLLSFLVLLLASCGQKNDTTAKNNPSQTPETSVQHNYADTWSYDEVSHWYACLDKGYEDLKKDEAAHSEDNEVIVKQATDSETGLARYTCSVCGHTYEKIIKIATSILSLPTVEDKTLWAGQTLSALSLSGGEGSVSGHFAWTNPDEVVKESGEYSVSFIPDDDDYATLTTTLPVRADYLTLTASAGANGKTSIGESANLLYGEDFTVIFTPDAGYAVENVVVDGQSIGAVAQYTFEKVSESHTVSVTFREYTADVTITCLSGTPNAYTIAGTTVTFTRLSQDSVYAISGLLEGNIVIDVGDDYKLDLELQGLTVETALTNPITVLSGDKVSLTAKNGYVNAITDKREAIDETDESLYSAAIYSLVDLEICGKGSLSVVSENNNGIHTKDDLEVKNLTLTVDCKDNALKGNDSVTLYSSTTTLIARAGDGIKTTNSNVSEKGNQRGTVTVSGGTHTIYAACDGIDAAYDVVIDNDATTLNIYTDKYSEYSEEVTAVSDSVYYIRFTSKSYAYAVKYYNSDSDFVWVTANYHSSVSGGRTTYYYYDFPKNAAYSKMQVFIYSSTMTPGQEDEYLACTDYLTSNTGYDTLAFTAYGNGLYYDWSNYTTSVSDGFGPGGPGNMGGGPGNMGGMNDGNTNKGDHSTKGIKAANSITVNGGTVTIKAYDDALHANNDTTLENGATPTGNVTVSGGTVTVYSNDDGLHADGTLTIKNGTVTVENSYEGLEGYAVYVEGGNVSVTSSDDGINSTTTTGEGIVISGGTLYVYAGGDGIDANSRTSYSGIVFSGGHTVVISTSGGNSAIDTEQGYRYEGGYVLALMPSGGMSSEATHCQNFSSIATNKTVSLSADQYLTVKSSSTTLVTVKVPTRLSAIAIVLGTKSATLSTSASCDKDLDANGVLWEAN